MVYGVGEIANPLVGLAVLVLAGQGVVETSHLGLLQLFIVPLVGALVMVTPERFVQVVEEVGSGRNDHINVVILNQIRDQPSHAGGDQRPRQPEEDRRVVRQHVEPQVVRFRQRARLKARAFHLHQNARHRAVTVNLDRARRVGQVFRAFLLSHHNSHQPLSRATRGGVCKRQHSPSVTPRLSLLTPYSR